MRFDPDRLLRHFFLLISLLAIGSTPGYGASVQELVARVNRLVQAGQLAAAEDAARQLVTEHPSSRDARLTLANVLLWREEYVAAIPMYREILETRPTDREARLGLANALYWSGDYRGARREFLVIDDHPEAARALSEIASASSPGGSLQGFHRSDSQPFRVGYIQAGGYVFSDPLTRWNGEAGTYTFEDAPVNTEAPFARLGVEVGAPALRSTLRASATLLRFGDGETRLMGSAGVDHRIGSSTLALTAARRELFGSELSVLTHPYADSLELRWQRENASLRGETLRYFDDNTGVAVDGWFLVPLRHFSAGASAAWRDTAESRFVATSVYDPYWTPIDLREARLIFTATRRLGRVDAGLHLDGGFAREELNGSYNPWRASVSFAVPLERLTLGLSAERSSTVFYTANEIRATLAARF